MHLVFYRIYFWFYAKTIFTFNIKRVALSLFYHSFDSYYLFRHYNYLSFMLSLSTSHKVSDLWLLCNLIIENLAINDVAIAEHTIAQSLFVSPAKLIIVIVLSAI